VLGTYTNIYYEITNLNKKNLEKHFYIFQIAVKREPAVAKEMSKLDTDKKMSRKEKDERILWKKNEVIEQN